MMQNTISFSTGTDGVQVLRLSKEGIWANPDIPVDETAKFVLNALDNNIKVLVQAAIKAEREACADIAENWNSNGMPRTGVANEIRARGQA
jgi:hypothetical protein